MDFLSALAWFIISKLTVLFAHCRFIPPEYVEQCFSVCGSGSDEQQPFDAFMERVCSLQAQGGSVALSQRDQLYGGERFQTTAGKRSMEAKQERTVGKNNCYIYVF